jgi:hypothetical protein
MSLLVPILLGALVVPAAPGERLTDRQVKELVERIHQERDRFEDQLDGNLKRSTFRGPNGEVNVERFLDDLQDNVGKLKDRFKPGYSADTEVRTVLEQGGRIQRYIDTQPPNYKGSGEWSRMATSLGELATAYGASFPMADGAKLHRLDDRELAGAASSLSQVADRFSKALDSSLKKDKTVAPANRQSAVEDAKALKKAAETLASRLKGGQPASADVTRLVEHVQRIRTTAAGLPLSPAAQQALGEAQRPLETIAGAFGLSPAKS